MNRYRWLVALAALTWVSGGVTGQSRPAPIYALPADGTWVEYDWKSDSPTQAKGKLWIRSVGQKQVLGVTHRWIELKLTCQKGDRTESRWRKVLLSETAFASGRPAEEIVAAAYRQDGPSAPVYSMRSTAWNDLLNMGFSSLDGAMQEVRPTETIKTKLGEFSCRHLKAQGKERSRTLEYHGWLTPKVPFGWATIEVREIIDNGDKITFTASAVATGTGAESELNESKVGPN